LRLYTGIGTGGKVKQLIAGEIDIHGLGRERTDAAPPGQS